MAATAWRVQDLGNCLHSWSSEVSFTEFGMSNQMIRNYVIAQHALNDNMMSSMAAKVEAVDKPLRCLAYYIKAQKTIAPKDSTTATYIC